MIYPILADPEAIEFANPNTAAATAPAAAQPVVEQFSFSALVTQHPWAVVAASAVAVLIFAWFGLRYWLAITRPVAIKEVHTPTIDRMNSDALDHMVGETVEDAEAHLQAKMEEQAPDDLLAIVPHEEEPTAKPSPEPVTPPQQS
jgi:hypothetical protein